MSERIAQGTLNRSKYKYDFDPTTGKWSLKQGANPKGPDYSGLITLDLPGGPIKLRLSGWVRRAQDGKPGFLSLSAEYPMDEQRRLQVSGAAPAADTLPPDTPTDKPEFDEDLPF